MASKTFTFNFIPENLAQLQTLPESNLSDPFAVAPLCILALCRYKDSKEDCFEMLNFLKGPKPLSNFDEQFLRDRLAFGQDFVPKSFFNGANPQNNYTVNPPFSITVSDNPYSYQNEGYVTLWMKSGGADSPRQITLRHKPSTNQWFVWQHEMLIGSIRIPVAQDEWA